MFKLAARGSSSHRNAAIVGLKVQSPLQRGWNKIHTKFSRSNKKEEKKRKNRKKGGFWGVLLHIIKNISFVSSCLVWTNDFIFLSNIFFCRRVRSKRKSQTWSLNLLNWNSLIPLRGYSSNTWSPPTCLNGPWAMGRVDFQELTKSKFYERIPSLRHTPPPHPGEGDYGNSYHRKIKLQFNHLLLMPFLYWILIHF